MTLKDQLDALLDATAFDSTGTKIGAVRQVYVDDATGKATFATVATGIFSSDAIVPLHGARLLDGELHVDHTRSAVRDSPRPDHTEDALTPDQEIELLEHYGVELPAPGGGGSPKEPRAERDAKVDAKGDARGEKKDTAKKDAAQREPKSAATPKSDAAPASPAATKDDPAPKSPATAPAAASAKPAEKADVKPDVKPDAKAGEKPGETPAEKPDVKAGEKPESTPTAPAAPKPAGETDASGSADRS